VPEDLARTGASFSFPLPKELVDLAASTEDSPKVNMVDGSPLPSWLHYRGSDKQFVATKVPNGALPLQVLVRIGVTRTVVQIRVKGQ